ncbi:MAG TPA: MBOAT family O-acyltransferase, partial [Burkholderiales bacterium]|nr:MBOAT family O-acyltransferase [Burkholderiales bacterium]
MLFNSYPFIFLFLPLAFAGFFVLARVSHVMAAAWLAAASLFFYGWWNPAYVGLLLGSIAFNYTLGMWIARAPAEPGWGRRRQLFVFSVTANLLLLGYYKYSNFFLENLAAVAGTAPTHADIILPLGISFFTFTQIAFLVDTWQGKVKEYNFIHYCLFVTYFPHLIAGPILHHAEMMPQFGRSATYRLIAENVAVGLTIFAIGLFKKVIVADGIAPYVGPLFDLPRSGVEPTFLEAWSAVLAYSLQLYFDFSGYSDMAIGLSLLFGVRLPLNFHSPYKASNISELWQRWHMTLTRFLRDYLFIPLGGQRKSAARRYFSVMATMVLCGLWHGAGWTYVAFGALQGAYLALNQTWRLTRKRLGWRRSASTWWGTGFAVLLTFAAWLVGLALFRSVTLPEALVLLRGMFGLHGFALPDQWLPYWGAFGAWLSEHGMPFTESRGLVRRGLINWFVVLLAVVWIAPNTQQIMAHFKPALGIPKGSQPARLLAWRPSVAFALVTA